MVYAPAARMHALARICMCFARVRTYYLTFILRYLIIFYINTLPFEKVKFRIKSVDLFCKKAKNS